MNNTYWIVDQHQALTAGVRTFLQTTYGHTAAPEHTYGAIVSIRQHINGGVTCLVTFPYTFVLAGMQTGQLEALIDTECRSRLLALRNAAPLTSILGTQHPL